MSQPSGSLRPAAASAVLRPAMTGPPVPARVLAAFPEAVYLAIEPADPDRAAATPPLVSIVSAQAAVQPGSVILPRSALPSRCHPGMVAAIGGGRIVLGDVTVSPTRWWSAAPCLPPVDASVLRARAGALQRSLLAAGAWDDDLYGRADAVAASLLAGDRDAALRAGRRLLGHGPGLTPSGDDVLCGLLVAATTSFEAHRRHFRNRVPAGPEATGGAPPAPHAAGTAAEGAIAVVRDTGLGIVEVARQGTTALSHGLLWHAVRGHAAGPVAAVLHALAGRAPLDRELPALLAVGSTSGRDLAIGLSAGALLAADLLGPAVPAAVASPVAVPSPGAAASPGAASSHGSELALHLDGRPVR